MKIENIVTNKNQNKRLIFLFRFGIIKYCSTTKDFNLNNLQRNSRTERKPQIIGLDVEETV